ncbi:26S proteasome non-ATPase regulatory subunit 1 [Sarcoptes scabiei]|uniref:26S proteasome non-ATPase regulatory subunit 1 n=2 Tax=Sarcoptes scabiei TaxID=52283 RepID=A0A834VI08_SARSC|nr:26S proteasome non-ATPase regulatory subunit 1 [Sarcoptes scabiei]
MHQKLHLTSASGIISLLDDSLPEMKIFALDKLNNVVDEFWAEISDVIGKIEVLYEDESFPHRKLAALVASKVYYHLGSFEDSLIYALCAGDLFNVNATNEYVDTIIAKSIDHYTKLRVANLSGDSTQTIDVRLENIVNRMFQRCFDDGQYKQAIGIALETRRMDMFEKAILQSGDLTKMLAYAFKITMSLIDNLHYRSEVLRILTQLYKNLHVPDYISMTQCLIFLDDAKSLAELLDNLIKEDDLLAYQIAFDLYESATQQFLSRILDSLKNKAPIASLLKQSYQAAKIGENASDSEKMETDTSQDSESSKPKSDSTSERKKEDLNEEDRKLQERFEKLAIILSGDISIELDLQFLIRNNHTDLLILKNTKDAVRNSVCHNATVISNGFMHCGTTSDQFLRDNLDWLSRAVNWAKFSATASLGVIHKRHEKEALHLMSSYLPKDNGPGSGYTEGGGLMALGLIHANHGGAIIEYLLNQLKGATNEAVKHGGCLGLGLAAMGTHRNDVYEQLKYNLYQDNAVIGEAAGIAMGLVMLGSKSQFAIQDMISYAQETQHEKILRGLALGISLIMFNLLEEADSLIETLCMDKDPLLRRSGMHTIAMAYCGTGNNKAIRKLLHVAVSDVNDDVRRAAVEALGFLLFRTSEQCPSVVSLLSESYNPHVRYGSAMALGISCAGTGNKEALSLLEPMTNDPVNFVRQGALIATALILIQQTESLCPKVKDFRAMYSKVISDKHDDVMAKFGAILAQGIIDAGGRNVTVSLQSRTGHTNLPAVVGMLIFNQFWYWFPLAHFISLAFTPTSLIGLNSDLKMPKIQYQSNSKPSVHGYPPPLEEKKEKEREKILTAVLSITAKAKKKEAEKKKEEKMEVDETPASSSTAASSNKTAITNAEEVKKSKKSDSKEKDSTESKSTKSEDKKEKSEEKSERTKNDPEPNFEMLSNPARVMPQQLKVIQMPENSRYESVKEISIGGIILMRDLKKSEQEELVEPVQAGGPKIEEEKEPDPPEPFEYIE